MQDLTSKKDPVSPDRREQAITAYARLLTSRPWEVKEKEIEGLRKAGLSDRAILQVNLVIDYFNFVNRLALGLNVELEEYWQEEN